MAVSGCAAFGLGAGRGCGRRFGQEVRGEGGREGWKLQLLEPALQAPRLTIDQAEDLGDRLEGDAELTLLECRILDLVQPLDRAAQAGRVLRLALGEQDADAVLDVAAFAQARPTATALSGRMPTTRAAMADEAPTAMVRQKVSSPAVSRAVLGAIGLLLPFSCPEEYEQSTNYATMKEYPRQGLRLARAKVTEVLPEDGLRPVTIKGHRHSPQ